MLHGHTNLEQAIQPTNTTVIQIANYRGNLAMVNLLLELGANDKKLEESMCKDWKYRFTVGCPIREDVSFMWAATADKSWNGMHNTFLYSAKHCS